MKKTILFVILAALLLFGIFVSSGFATPTETPEITTTSGVLPASEQPTAKLEISETVPPTSTPAPTATPKSTPAVVTHIWNEDDAIALAQMAWGEARGLPRDEIAQTMWCVLNRVDHWGGTPYSQCTAPSQFVGYSSSNPLDFYDLAVDVLTRWEQEKQGIEIERELGPDYLFFTGDGVANYFRTGY